MQIILLLHWHSEQLLSLYYENKNTACLHTDGVYHLYGSQHKESALRNDYPLCSVRSTIRASSLS